MSKRNKIVVGAMIQDMLIRNHPKNEEKKKNLYMLIQVQGCGKIVRYIGLLAI